MAIHHVHNLAEFNALISSGKAVAIDFYAIWCGPCKMIAPKFEELSNNFPSVHFLKIDVDNQSVRHKDIAEQCGISAMPTFQFYKNGQKVGEIVGADPNALEAKVKQIAA